MSNPTSTAQLYTLTADYGTEKSVIHSADETTLRTFGKDHHNGAKSKPELTLADPLGRVIATMDVWATDWMEV